MVKGCKVNLKLLCHCIWSQREKMQQDTRNAQEICQGAREGRQGGAGNQRENRRSLSPSPQAQDHLVLTLDIDSPLPGRTLTSNLDHTPNTD